MTPSRSRVFPTVTLSLLVAGFLPELASAQSLTLAEALDSALATHPSLAAADARVRAADDAGDAARAARLPGAALSATLTHFELPMVVAPLHSLDLRTPPEFDRTLVQGQLAVQYTLFDGGGRSSGIRGADANFDATRFSREATRMQVLVDGASAYIGVLSARAVLEAASAQARALTEEHARAQRQFDAGAAPELEVLRASATLQSSLAEEASAQARVALAERALARVMGVEPGLIAGRTFADVEITTVDVRGDGTSNPMLLQADRAVAAAQARLAGERAGRLPSVQAGAGLLDFGTLDGSHDLEWQAGLQVSWPLFTGGARAASVRRAEADVVAARGDLDVARLQVEQAVDAAATAVVEADARAEALAVALAQWDEVTRIEALALETGSGTQSDLLSAQAGLYQARAGQAQARYNAILARVQLARAEGVLDLGWINESLESR